MLLRVALIDGIPPMRFSFSLFLISQQNAKHAIPIAVYKILIERETVSSQPSFRDNERYFLRAYLERI